jgi:outer membrane lipopolysaccharide assembly protein LptE/RlpB
MRKKTICQIIGIAFGMGMICTSVGCGRGFTVDEELSPEVKDVHILSKSEENGTQSVLVELIFDQAVEVQEAKKDTLRITIAGNRIKDEEYTLTQTAEDTVQLAIEVEAVTNGILTMQAAEDSKPITAFVDTEKAYATKPFEVEGIIPSGVTLATVDTQDGYIEKAVETSWEIRSIAWMGLFENGELVPAYETSSAESLDGYVALHGHEYDTETSTVIAQRLVELLESNYSEEYQFACNGERLYIQKEGSDAQLDLQIYQYVRLNGEELDEDALHALEGVSFDGIKTKVTLENRTMSTAEQALVTKLYRTQATCEAQCNAALMYQTIRLTGTGMPEEQIYAFKDLEELVLASLVNQEMYELGMFTEQKSGEYGLHLSTFLELAGATISEDVNVILKTREGEENTLSLAEQKEAMLLLGEKSGPSETIDVAWFENGKLTKKITDVAEILIVTDSSIEDPQYRFHHHGLYADSLEIPFTMEVYRDGEETALQSISWTTSELEALMIQYPEAVVGNYYGTIGNAETYSYMGVGGWLDYYEGIRLSWLLDRAFDWETWEGRAELIDRDGEVYAQIEDLSYFRSDSSSYYVLSEDGVQIPQTEPMLAVSKNGYPLLKDHDHESEAYVAYNQLNQNLAALGIEVETGVVKNHSGPFVACLGNYDSYYGGNQIETGGDCISIRFYIR